MLKFTLDTNCIIDIDAERCNAPAVRKLADAHAAGKAHVAVVAITASEKQPDGRFLSKSEVFHDRLSALNLGHLPTIQPMAYWGVTFWNESVWAGPEEQKLASKIESILFPENTVHEVKARNRLCDVQVIWAHIWHKRDVFVTSDEVFHKSKQPDLIRLGAGRIMRPHEAAALL
jgi:hypothetical protein